LEGKDSGEKIILKKIKKKNIELEVKKNSK